MKERKRFTEQSQGYFDFMMRYFYLTRQLMCGRYIFNFNSVTLEGRKPDHGHFPWKCGSFRKVPTCKCANSLAQYCDSMFGHSEFRVVRSGSTLRDHARSWAETSWLRVLPNSGGAEGEGSQGPPASHLSNVVS